MNPTIDANFFPQVVADQGLAEYIKWYNDLTLVAYSVLLKGQYNQKGIEKDAYKTNNNELKLNKLLDEESDPNSWVLNYVTKQFGGSVALFTTSKVNHLVSILKSDVWK